MRKQLFIYDERMRFSFLFLFLLFFGSCSKGSLRSPSSTAYSPEANGEFLRTNASLSFERRAKYEVALDSTKASTQVDLKNDYYGGRGETPYLTNKVDASIGVSQKLDLHYTQAFEAGMGLLGLKYQILGASRITAKPGNFSLSFLYAESSRSIANIDPATVESDINGDPYVLDVSRYHNTLHLAASGRFSDVWLGYINLNKSFESFSGKSVSAVSSLHGIKVANKAQILGLSSGIIYREKEQDFLFELNYKKYKWNLAKASVFIGLVFRYSYSWDFL